jgi:hypothetical protein
MGRGRVTDRFRCLEGRHVSVALADGSRIDDCELISAGHHGAGSLWLYADGTDTFVALVDVADVREVVRRASTSAT